MSVLDFINELHDFCVAKAEAELPFSSTYTFEPSDDGKLIFTGNVYEAALEGFSPVEICTNAAIAHDLVMGFKCCFFLGEEEFEIMGDKYEDYCEALAMCLARLDYAHYKSYLAQEINYDFYKICLDEGIKFNRTYFYQRFDASIGLYLIDPSNKMCSHIVKRLVTNAEKNDLKLKDVILSIDGNVLLRDVSQSVDSSFAMYEKLLKDQVFLDEVMPILPFNVQDALIRKDKSNLNFTIFAYYIQAIKSQYGDKLSVKISDQLFESALDLVPGSCRSYRNRKKTEMSWASDSALAEIYEKFPKFKLKY